MNSFVLLAAIAAVLGSAWTVLGLWVVGERSLHDRARAQADRDARALDNGAVTPSALSRRRLRRAALGSSGHAGAVAAAELVRIDGRRLRATAAVGRRAARLRALTVLARGRDETARLLIRVMLENGDVAATNSLLRLAGELPSEDADELLLEALVAGRLSRARTATELEPRTARLRAELIALTAAEEPELRYWAITLLQHEMEHDAAVEAVCARRTDNSPSVRAAVAEALGFASGGSVGPLLRQLLADDVFYVRSHAARAVAQRRDESLADELLPLLADRNWWVRAAAKESLGALGEAGLRIAMAALSHGDAFARDGALEIIAAMKGLAEIGGSRDASDVVRQAVTVLRTSSALDVAEVA